jgi:hypothetical protein
VDVFSPTGANVAGTMICLHGLGDLLFLNANGAPRTAAWMPETVMDGWTCTMLPTAGTLVLVGEFEGYGTD